MSRLPVRKTYKLFVGGEFPRSESGRDVRGAGAERRRASRKDVRDAVGRREARSPKWAGMTAYNRGQVLYRIAEMMEARAAEFAELCVRSRGGRGRRSTAGSGTPGWADKSRRCSARSNPVAGAVLQLHGARADRRRRRPRAGRAARSAGSSRGSRR